MIPVSKKRLFTTTVGIILAVAIIFTSYTLGNNMARYQFYDQIEKHPYEIELGLEANGNLSNVLKSYNEIENVTHIKNVDLFTWTTGSYDGNLGKIIPINYVKGVKIKLLNGTMPATPDEVLASSYSFNKYNWRIGERINVSFYNSSGYGTFIMSYRIVGVGNPVYSSENSQNSGHQSFEGVLTTFKSMETLYSRGANINIYMGIKIDPGYLLNSTDYNAASHKIDNIRMEVEEILQFNGIYYNNVETYYVSNYGTGFLLYAIFFSLPIIVMGAYLSRVGIEIEFLERRREFGVLKIRGATRGSLAKFVMIEALIYSLIGGILGYFLGEGLAYISNIIFFRIPYFMLDLNIGTLIGAIVTALFLFFIAIYSPWKKIKNESIVNLISHYSQAFKKVEYKTFTRDLVISVGFWSYMLLAIWLIHNTNLSGGFNIIVILAFVVLMTITFMFPVILIILPLTMSKLLTMGTTKIYRVLASQIAKLFKTSGELAERSIERNPKRAAYLAFILAFILTLSTFLAVTMDNTNYISEIQRKSTVGGDMVIVLNNQKIPWNIINDTQKVSKYVIAYQLLNYSLDGNYIYSMNMNKYIHLIYNGDVFVKEGKFDEHGIVITYDYAKQYGIKLGDYVNVQINNTMFKKYRVEAIMYSFPGISDGVYGILDTNKTMGTPTYIIIRSNNIKSLEESLVGSGYYYNVEPPRESIYVAEIEFMNTLLIYLVILGAAAIFIVQYSSLLNRRGEIALYKVRGAKTTQIAAMLMTEGLTVIILSLLIGTFTGLALAYMMSSLMITNATMPSVFFIGYTFVLYTAILVVAYVVSQWILSYIFARTKPSEVIRGLGGEI